MKQSKGDDADVHPEVEDDKYLGVSEGKHYYTDYLGECDAVEYLQRVSCLLLYYVTIYYTI